MGDPLWMHPDMQAALNSPLRGSRHGQIDLRPGAVNSVSSDRLDIDRAIAELRDALDLPAKVVGLGEPIEWKPGEDC